MLSGLVTKVALKKAGLPSDTFDFASSSGPSSSLSRSLSSANVSRSRFDYDDDPPANSAGSWTSWMSVKSLPLTAQAWFTPPAPPVAVGKVPGIGDMAPLDRHGKLAFGRGKKTLVVFLRCVGCAWAQRSFVSLRTLANRYSSTLHCIAVSHASPQATKKWIDLIGGAWNVQVVIDEDRAIYAAWGLGLSNMWYLFNPTTQAQGWREKGWLGEKVAGAIQRKSNNDGAAGGKKTPPPQQNSRRGQQMDDDYYDDEDAVSTVMGNKWQEAGAFAVDGKGIVVWGGKAVRADDVMDLDFGARILVI